MAGLQLLSRNNDVISVDDVKQHIGVTHDLDDGIINTYLLAALKICEEVTDRVANETDYAVYYDAWPSCRYLPIPRAPVITALVEYKDTNGEWQTFSDYSEDFISPTPRLYIPSSVTLPDLEEDEVNVIRIDFTAGYQGGEYSTSLPDNYRQAVYLLTSHYYQNREAVLVGTNSKEIEFAVNALLGSLVCNNNWYLESIG